VLLRGVQPYGGALAAQPPPAIAAFLGENAETYLLGPDAVPRPLTAYPTEAASVSIPRVALDPTGRFVATTRPVDIRSEVILVAVDSGALQSVAGTRERYCQAPSFHPDGQHLVAVCAPGGTYYSDRSVMLFHRERGYVRILLPEHAPGIQFWLGGALVAPDGSYALVTEYMGDGATRIWRLNLHNARFSLFDVPWAQPFSVQPAAFSPDGRILASACLNCTGAGPGPAPLPQTDFVLLSAEGRIERTLHSVDSLAGSPALSPDGGMLLYTTYTASVPTLWRVNLATGERRLIAGGRMVVYPQVSALDAAGAAATPILPPSGTPIRLSEVWTVILHGDLSSEAEARGRAQAAASRYLSADVLFSSDYPNLRPGYWVVYSGAYASEDDARAGARHAQEAGYPGAYPRWLGPPR
jgi:WD40 repeat protein